MTFRSHICETHTHSKLIIIWIIKRYFYFLLYSTLYSSANGNCISSLTIKNKHLYLHACLLENSWDIQLGFFFVRCLCALNAIMWMLLCMLVAFLTIEYYSQLHIYMYFQLDNNIHHIHIHFYIRFDIIFQWLWPLKTTNKGKLYSVAPLLSHIIKYLSNTSSKNNLFSFTFWCCFCCCFVRFEKLCIRRFQLNSQNIQNRMISELILDYKRNDLNWSGLNCI